MQGPATVRSHTISYKVSDERKTNKKLQSSSHMRSASQVPDHVSDRISDHLIRKPVEQVGRLEDDNVQLSTIGKLTGSIQKSLNNADSRENIQHTTSNRTYVSISNSYEEVYFQYITFPSCRFGCLVNYLFIFYYRKIKC